MAGPAALRAGAPVATALGALVALELALVCLAERRAPDPTLHGVRLGMSEAELRASFVEASLGTWTEKSDCAEGFALEWDRTDARTATQWARFELHEGVLVGLRLREVGPCEEPAHVEATPASVRVCRVGPGGTASVTWLARGCPSHQGEVSGLLALGP